MLTNRERHSLHFVKILLTMDFSFKLFNFFCAELLIFIDFVICIGCTEALFKQIIKSCNNKYLVNGIMVIIYFLILLLHKCIKTLFIQCLYQIFCINLSNQLLQLQIILTLYDTDLWQIFSFHSICCLPSKCPRD